MKHNKQKQNKATNKFKHIVKHMPNYNHTNSEPNIRFQIYLCHLLRRCWCIETKLFRVRRLIACTLTLVYV